MADVIIPPGYGLATLFFYNTIRANPFTITMGYAFAAGTTDASEAAESMYDAATHTGSIATNATMDTGWSFTGVNVHQNEGGVIHGGGSTGGTVFGSHSGDGDPLVNTASVIFRKITPLIGKRNRGRCYVPPLVIGTSSVGADGTIAPSKVGQLTAIAGTWFTQMAASLTQPFLLHSHPDDAPTVITALQVPNRVGTQRRRIR